MGGQGSLKEGRVLVEGRKFSIAEDAVAGGIHSANCLGRAVDRIYPTDILRWRTSYSRSAIHGIHQNAFKVWAQAVSRVRFQTASGAVRDAKLQPPVNGRPQLLGPLHASSSEICLRQLPINIPASSTMMPPMTTWMAAESQGDSMKRWRTHEMAASSRLTTTSATMVAISNACGIESGTR